MKNKHLFRNLLFLLGFALFGINSYAQSVSGTVSDADGPLPGANVIVLGTSNGVVTDFDGNYTIDNVTSDAVLQFSFVGYVAKEVSVNGQSVINVTMIDDANQLDEVVVIGYTSQTRGDITGSVASVDMDEAMKMPVVNAAEALQGRVTGVTVTNAGSPGAAPKITIRGFGTSNNTDPLYIIDGVQTDDANILNSIDPADIDQMNVLKDAAASIYGARASNGVIIVTTKSGGYNMDRSILSFDIYSGISEASNLPDLLNPEQHGNMIWESLANDGFALEHPQYGTGPSAVVPDKLQGVPVSVTIPNGGTYWPGAITQTAPTTNVSLSLQNGTESGKSFMSVNYLTRDGVLKYTGFERMTTRINSEFKIKDIVRIGEHMNVAYSNTNSRNDLEMALRVNPLIPTHDDDGNFAGSYAASAQIGNSNNPLANLYRAKDNYGKSLRVFGDVYAGIDILDGLTFKTTLGFNLSNWDARSFSPLNPEHSEPVSTNTLTVTDNSSFGWNWTNILNYRKSFGDHNINALVGVEAVKNTGDGKQISRTGYLFENPDFYNLSNGSGTPNVAYNYRFENSLFSYFGSIDYNFRNKYFFTATVRSDTSSRFKGDNKTGVFPAFSGGWLLSGEDFYNDGSVVNRIKLKASWGQMGNQSLPRDNPTVNISSLDEQYANYQIGGSSIVTGAMLSQVGNPNLKWETSESLNFGIDLGFFESKLLFSAEWYQIDTKDLIALDNSLISTTAIDAGAPLVNLGSVQNTGYDISIGYHDKTDSEWSYGIDINISHYKNEVKELISDFYSGSSFRTGVFTRTEVGQPISSFYGRQVIGIFNDVDEVRNSPNQGWDLTKPEEVQGYVGRFKYKDIDGDGTVNDTDRTYIGSPHPDFTYGINLVGGFKGFDISMFFTGSQGNDIYNYEKIYTDFPSFFNGNRSTRVLNSWTPTNTNTDLPALSKNLTNNEANANSFFVEDGSYFRMKNLQIGYTFGKNYASKIGSESIRIYLQGSNLFTITGYDGLDPEVVSYDNLTLGVDNGVYPISKIYTIGLNIKF